MRARELQSCEIMCVIKRVRDLPDGMHGWIVIETDDDNE